LHTRLTHTPREQVAILTTGVEDCDALHGEIIVGSR
jgi:hypothetical protein